MLIPLNKKYALGANKYSWFIAEAATRTQNGEDIIEWKATSWHPTPAAALEHCVGARLRASNASTLAELLNIQEVLQAELREALTPHFEVGLKEEIK